MDGKEAIETLQQVSAILATFTIVIAANNTNSPINFAELSIKMAEATVVAKEAIELMDSKLEVEKKDNGEDKK